MRGYIEVNLKNVLSNCKFVKKRLPVGVKLAAVVKADAYGHGARRIAETLEEKVDYFVVATVGEGEEVREITKKPILCLSPFSDKELKRCILKRIETSVSCEDDLKRIIRASEYMNIKAYVHLCVDTGMNRMGIKTEKSAYKLINSASLCRTVAIKGVYSHFFDGGNGDINEEQAERFDKIAEKFGADTIKHMAATDTCLNENYRFDMVRLGIGLYGYGIIGLKPCMSFKSRVARVCRIKAGETVGYGGKFVAKKNCFSATISAGYADGVPRSFTGGEVLIGGKRRKIIGSVCMDYCFALVDGSVSVGDEVVFIGEQSGEVLTAEDMAKPCKTIPYEILTGVKRFEKIYIK